MTYEALRQIVGEIDSLAWLELIKAAAPVVTAVIAYQALKNWKRQDRAKREAEFLDHLLEAIHAYVPQMTGSITQVDTTLVGFRCWQPSEQSAEREIAGAIAYVMKWGKEDAKRLFHTLDAIRPAVAKLDALSTKGQIFDFEGYEACWQSVKRLTDQFTKLEGFATIVGSESLNWDNPEVRAVLRKIMLLDPDDVRAQLQKNQRLVLDFVTATYRRIYG